MIVRLHLCQLQLDTYITMTEHSALLIAEKLMTMTQCINRLSFAQNKLTRKGDTHFKKSIPEICTSRN